MSWFTKPFATSDWNGDGRIDHWDDALETMRLADMLREDRISRLERAIRDSGLEQVGNEEFEVLCAQSGVRVSEFDQSDVDELQRRLNR